jgi:hypothetical protein
MSTEHQQYSTENQHAAIQRYADEHGLLIVRTFTDAGKSGVGIQGRDALQELLRIVNNGAADFATILVYDVSGGAASKTRMKRLTTNSNASVARSPSNTAPSISRTTRAP